ENMPIVDCMFFYFDRVFELCEKHGIDKSRLILDPGIGFALSKKENYQLIQSVELIREKGFEVFLGVSRKRFIVNTILGLDIDADPETEEGFANRDVGSAIITAFAVAKEVEYVRIHSLDEHKMAVAITSNIIHADEAEDITFDQYTNNN
ncbi:MAG TPA: dihydropteroate synthase, partial [Alloiococcus sp.]|nr:dihydropteroate synthase [Alloiococcus sp.]